ncbi:hypothetical protein CDAR_514511 [Caerostris darwini]|uniref:Uncharacterized protein n=1 Tax=Caerostris darwini TaxID=1538125 RepID=A0AAV4UHS2_9ARAC|nr:hypothetical protein CDAR_514511 [Caerostris darwini]
MYSSDNETSVTSASEDIGSEDTPEESREFELDFRSSSTSSSGASSAAISPRRSPRLEKKRSRIMEKEGVSFRTKRRRIVSPSPDIMVDPAASWPQSPVPEGSPAAVQRSSASPSPPPPPGRTTRSGRFHPYSKPASPAAAARPPPPPASRPSSTTRAVTRSQTGSLSIRTSPSGKRPLEESTYQTRASKRLLNAWQLTEAESQDLRQWRKSAYERFEALESLAPTDPRTLPKGKKQKRTQFMPE